MAILKQGLMTKVKTSALPRVTGASNVAELLQTIQTRLDSAYWVSDAQVLDGARLSGVIPQGGATANVLSGKDGTGKAHISLKTQCLYGNVKDGEFIMSELKASAAKGASMEDLMEEYYAWLDEVTIPLTIWVDSEPESFKAARAQRGSFEASLRVDQKTGNISLAQSTPEGFTDVVKIPRRAFAGTEMPDTSVNPPAIELRNVFGSVMSFEDASSKGVPLSVWEAAPIAV